MRTTDRVRLWPLGVGVALLVGLAGCGSSSSAKAAATAPPASTATTTPSASITTPAPAGGASALSQIGAATATGLTVSLAKGAPGIFLIGPNGHTLYIFSQDKGAASACTSAACVKAWPALTATGSPTSGPSINSSQVSTEHGQVANQVTYYGHLLYYFHGDTAPGQTDGTSVPNFDLLGPFGNEMLPKG
jgi:predicted lipoprotein with Yx(FWY)xxD motif